MRSVVPAIAADGAGGWTGPLSRPVRRSVPVAQRFAVVALTWKRSAARRIGHLSGTTQRATRSLPSSDSGACSARAA
ncbi:hypothetical protein FHX34_105140 [Actinoplanes teichomyceticus]|uniref:Uncharacterized protein n=1 Tax=Actinoplanes teichomyceticus TaxID=1867 RepID=A0A561VKX6_ACTTI|nr:hypothetical protein FHX34_105140 [Actinoplanes teichomyceticus]GIF14213.1 hypothetical protein Ate01nite_42450 [Actinoplanes teichomyceticus]